MDTRDSITCLTSNRILALFSLPQILNSDLVVCLCFDWQFRHSVDDISPRPVSQYLLFGYPFVRCLPSCHSDCFSKGLKTESLADNNRHFDFRRSCVVRDQFLGRDLVEQRSWLRQPASSSLNQSIYPSALDCYLRSPQSYQSILSQLCIGSESS